MANEQSDKQPFVMYNGAQLSCVNTTLNVPCTTLLNRALFDGMGGGQGILLLEQVGVRVDDPPANFTVIDSACVVNDLEDGTNVCALLLGDVTEGFGQVLVHDL